MESGRVVLSGCVLFRVEVDGTAMSPSSFRLGVLGNDRGLSLMVDFFFLGGEGEGEVEGERALLRFMDSEVACCLSGRSLCRAVCVGSVRRISVRSLVVLALLTAGTGSDLRSPFLTLEAPLCPLRREAFCPVPLQASGLRELSHLEPRAGIECCLGIDWPSNRRPSLATILLVPEEGTVRKVGRRFVAPALASTTNSFRTLLVCKGGCLVGRTRSVDLALPSF